ncbi:MAG: VOC family protein [Candidatus Thorarchaeota archaeon]|nr:VOC family protein [Candidatus Thorarchaeota archaeon]
MPRVIHFEIVSDNADRTRKFYESVFGWAVEKWKGPTDYWFLVTGDHKEPGIDGAFGMRQSTEDSIVNTIDVEDIDKYIELVRANRGKIVRPKSPVPGVGCLAYFRDTEGNLWGMMQNDPGAE